jgi:hypothetical protein
VTTVDNPWSLIVIFGSGHVARAVYMTRSAPSRVGTKVTTKLFTEVVLALFDETEMFVDPIS